MTTIKDLLTPVDSEEANETPIKREQVVIPAPDAIDRELFDKVVAERNELNYEVARLTVANQMLSETLDEVRKQLFEKMHPTTQQAV